LFDIYSQKWNVDRDNFIISLDRLLLILSQSTLGDFILEQKYKLYQLSIEEWFLISQIYLTMNGWYPTISPLLLVFI
ncbi:hypothetical protein, partial [Corallococcus sp. AB038B]|uniref:hypothetical protein n=1 Tax=Corallococcus sp. AB038B TaxID=2316718 RepID=UPI001F3D2EC2